MRHDEPTTVLRTLCDRRGSADRSLGLQRTSSPLSAPTGSLPARVALSLQPRLTLRDTLAGLRTIAWITEERVPTLANRPVISKEPALRSLFLIAGHRFRSRRWCLSPALL